MSFSDLTFWYFCKRRMRLYLSFYVKTSLAIICLMGFCEYLIYYIVQSSCKWPRLNPKDEDATVRKFNYRPVKIMVLADTHLLGTRNGHWFDKLRREWQMYRAFQTAMVLHNPELVFILGDIFDEGSIGTKADFERYVKRFYSLFSVPLTTKLYVVAGNHDMGFHVRLDSYLKGRFEAAFNTSAIELVSVRGNHFVLVNSMTLEGDGCHFCRRAEEDLIKIEKILMCTQEAIKCDSKMKLDIYSQPILMQHFPLYRESDEDCDDFDAAPTSIKREPFREKWDCLSEGATYQLLQQIKPRVALSGHTHHGCTRDLLTGDGIEITMPSFNWRNKNNPNYALGVLTPYNYAFVKCEMPREYTVVAWYVFGVVAILAWVKYSVFSKRRRYTYTSKLQ